MYAYFACTYSVHILYMDTPGHNYVVWVYFAVEHNEAGNTSDLMLSPANLGLIIVGTSLLGVGNVLFCIAHLIMKQHKSSKEASC